MKHSSSGASFIEILLILTVLALMATLFVPLASGLVDVQRANGQIDELKRIYTAIVGDPRANTYGYLGDVGTYPASLMDLVVMPAGATGWNGPYLNNVRIDSGILYDQFGGAIEYFNTTATGTTDQIALISKGTDRTSTNNASNPNQSSGFSSPFPGDSSYASATHISNMDNIVYPAFMDNTNLANYQSLGTVNIAIRNFDENSTSSANQEAPFIDFAPGCPGVYDIIISSLTHPTSSAHPYEAWVTYAPGGASFDLLQGNYLVSVKMTGSFYTVWQEQISVQPGKTQTRYISLPGVVSSASIGSPAQNFSTVSLTIKNSKSTDDIQPMMYGTNLGGSVSHNGGSQTPNNVQRCARIDMQDGTASGHPIIDSFIMPASLKTTLANYTKTYVDSFTRNTLIVTNSLASGHNNLAVYDNGVLIGTIGRRGNKNVKSFLIQAGDTADIYDDAGNFVATRLMNSSPQTYP